MTLESRPQSAAPAGRSLLFDLVRGLASQMVLIGHLLNVLLPAVFMAPGKDGLLEARAGLAYPQNLGVMIFFYLSGYLITMSVLRKSANPDFGLPEFIADRFARIFTPLLPLLILVYIGDNAVFAGTMRNAYAEINSSVGDLLLNAAMLAGNPAMAAAAEWTGLEWLSSTSLGSADQLWTVIAEWWIYMVFGIAFFAGVRRRRWHWICILACIGLVAVALPLLLGLALHTPGLIIAWAIGMGAAAANGTISGLRRAWLAGIGLAAAVGAFLLLAGNGWNFYAPIPAVLMGFAFFALVYLVGDLSLVRRSEALAWAIRFMSNVSYSLYLLHLSLIFWAAELFPSLVNQIPSVILLFIVSNFAAWLFYLAFERHHPLIRRAMQPLLDALPSPYPSARAA